MIKLLTVLNWFTTKKDFLAIHNDSDSAKKAATKLWNSVDSGDFIPVLVMIGLVAAVAFIYYFPFNNKSGRHYHMKYWWFFYAAAIAVAALFTYALLAFVVAKNPSFDTIFLLKCTAVNVFYACLLYPVASYFCIKSGKSNAYPFI